MMDETAKRPYQKTFLSDLPSGANVSRINWLADLLLRCQSISKQLKRTRTHVVGVPLDETGTLSLGSIETFLSGRIELDSITATLTALEEAEGKHIVAREATVSLLTPTADSAEAKL